MSARALRSAPALLGAAAFVLYVATAARTIGWWDASHYPWLATSLGISSPPGALLLTVIGWLWTRVVWLRPVAFQLNVLAAAIGALTVVFVAASAWRASAELEPDRGGSRLAALAAAGWFATAVLPWSHATQFTPYGLSVLFSALLLWLALRWWQQAATTDAVRALAWVAFVLGLDFSVHRTNLLLAPALLLAVLLRRPGLLLRPRAVGACVAAFALGVASQLGYLALAMRGPGYRMVDMSSVADLWSYIRLDSIGGGFLVNIWPRRADFLHVQLADWSTSVWRNLAAQDVLRAVALAVTLAGAGFLTRRSPRAGLFVLGAVLSAGLGAVIYFNRPVEYMRPLDRHYLASLVPIAVLFGMGAEAAARAALRWAPRVAAPVVSAFAVVLLLAAAGGNHSRCDRSHTRYAELWARDLLEPLEPNAILFTNGDNDTFPLLCMQSAEQLRPDVLVLNRWMLTAPAGVAWLGARAPDLGGVPASEHALLDVVNLNAGRRPVYASITVPSDSESTLWANSRLEGLAVRLFADSAGTSDLGPLERFVSERVPRVGITDRRQLLEPEMGAMLTNYLYSAFQLALAQGRRGDIAGARDTLDVVERQLDRVRLGPIAEMYEQELRRQRGFLKPPS